MRILTRHALLVSALLLATGPLMAQDFEATEAKIREAMRADIRGAADTDRDGNRRPVETLEFFGLRDDMRILELLPGGGWYTKILAPVMAENGEYFAALGTGRIKDRLADQPGFENMNIVGEDSNIYRPEGSRFYVLETDGLGVEDVDIVFTFRNYHNFSADGRAAMNEAAFAALKSMRWLILLPGRQGLSCALSDPLFSS